MLECRPVAAHRGMHRLLQLIELGVSQAGEGGSGRRGRRLIGAQPAQLAYSEADLCDRRVILSEVRGVAGQQESALIGFGVGEGAVEVVQSLQDIVGALHAGAGVRQRRQFRVAHKADRQYRAQRDEECQCPIDSTVRDGHRCLVLTASVGAWLTDGCTPVGRALSRRWRASRQRTRVRPALRSADRIRGRCSPGRHAL